MPYCTQCGRPVRSTDRFCAHCGAAQPGQLDVVGGLSPRAASVLCYLPLLGWVAAIVVLASERFRHNQAVRFHAFQGLYLFVAWLLVDWVAGPAFRAVGPGFVREAVVGLLKAVVWVAWILMLVKAAREEMYRLPVIGELAERSIRERR